MVYVFKSNTEMIKILQGLSGIFIVKPLTDDLNCVLNKMPPAPVLLNCITCIKYSLEPLLDICSFVHLFITNM